ncbi:Outer-membrane lipoprotein carrier protein [bacterium HR21]|jgi:outer membrane lipoprotein-sorting protein|nr:Outer-membrane lipoprotein carrier protein [bacterium HR21]
MSPFGLCILLAMASTLARGEELQELRRFSSRLQSIAVEARSETGIEVALLAARGNRFRLQWQGRLVVCDGKTVWNYSPEHRQVVISEARRLSGGLEQVFTAFLEHAHLRIVERRADTLRVECLPASSSPSLGFRSAVLTVRRGDWTPLALELRTEASTQRWELRNFRANPPVRPEDFAFTPPPGTEVIRLTPPGQ